MSPQPRGRLLTHGHGDEELDGEVDDEHAGGGGALRRWIPAAFPPSDILRRQPSVSLFLALCFSTASLRNTKSETGRQKATAEEDRRGEPLPESTSGGLQPLRRVHHQLLQQDQLISPL